MTTPAEGEGTKDSDAGAHGLARPAWSASQLLKAYSDGPRGHASDACPPPGATPRPPPSRLVDLRWWWLGGHAGHATPRHATSRHAL